ncbi:MAG: DUF4389 domain-containing protein [Gemmatimonadaceae bacterium]
MQTRSFSSTLQVTDHPVAVSVEPAVTHRNRLTCAFRPILALPHILLVGGPVAFALSIAVPGDGKSGFEWGGGGVLGAVAVVCAIIAWFAIVFGFPAPSGLENLVTLYVRWRVRAVAYLALLRDEYPPFGEGDYPATLRLPPAEAPRDRVTVAFRLLLALPHLVAIWVLGVAWAITTIIAWFSILFTGNYPRSLYRFATGVLQWNTRVEAYVLLLRDQYPPFSLD